ncbi:hypothetical protein E4634_08175 [Mangrovimicrobium sediminis]|uniref:Type II secretion system protein GspC N-terminal domain-containing protein n=1 Tax=Mangrovimicrobium sediminis TaxID=2562682 RepID=A0A4Z0M3M4_9GAMM|nr:hypothetical protein [Haliea sp. SAOS-164]TGD74101.1 hypothetical protein E4634_08175 [Haliea sp. SAOS-164]
MELVLVVLALLLLVQLAWGVFRLVVPSLSSPLPPAADALVVGAVHAGSVLDEEQRAEFRNRPLFWESRAPVAVAEPVKVSRKPKADEKLGKLNGVKLTGVFGSGDSAGIIFSSKGKEHRVMVGEAVNGWRLETVEPQRAVFSGNDKQAELLLEQVAIPVSVQQQGASAAPASSHYDAAEDQAAGHKTQQKKAGKNGKNNKAATSDSLSLGGGSGGAH